MDAWLLERKGGEWKREKGGWEREGASGKEMKGSTQKVTYSCICDSDFLHCCFVLPPGC